MDDELHESGVTHEEVFKIGLYGSALKSLAEEDPRFVSNLNTWKRWEIDMRLWWIRRIEKQVKTDPEFKLIGSKVVTRVMKLRLDRR